MAAQSKPRRTARAKARTSKTPKPATCQVSGEARRSRQVEDDPSALIADLHDWVLCRAAGRCLAGLRERLANDWGWRGRGARSNRVWARAWQRLVLPATWADCSRQADRNRNGWRC